MSTNDNSSNIQGVIPPLLTAFDKQGEIDGSAQKEIVQFLNEHVHGYYVAGTYGSGPMMTNAERKKILEITMDAASPDKSIIAHIGTTDTRSMIELGKHASEQGVDAVAAVPPYYYGHREEEVERHFDLLASEIDTPIFFYNNPSTTGFDLTYTFLTKLVEKGSIQGVKDSSFDIMKFYNFIKGVKDAGKFEDTTFIVGTEALIIPAYLAGANGSIAGLANAIPEDVISCYESLKGGDTDSASSIQEKVLREREIAHYDPSLVSVQALLRERGVNAGFPRDPFTLPSDKTVEKMRQDLKQLGISL